MKSNAGIWGAGVAVVFALMAIGSEQAQAPARDAAPAGEALPVWAYPVSTSGPLMVGDATAASGEPVEHIAGSSAGYTKTQIANLFVAADWFRGRIRRCRRWLRRGAGLLFMRAHIAISRADWAGLRTRAWRGCRRRIWKSRWRISGTVCGAVRSRAWDRRAG